MDSENEKRKQVLQVGFLTLFLVVTLGLVFRQIYLATFAQQVKIPAGFTVLSYVDSLKRADENNDGAINALDVATTLKNYGRGILIPDPKFGAVINSLQLSFVIGELNTHIDKKVEDILKVPSYARDYSNEKVLANEAEMPENIASSALPDSAPSGAAPSSGETFGKSIVPTVLGTVAAYTGASAFDYPIQTPQGPGGFGPSLSVSYSSMSVDDARANNDKAFKEGEAYRPSLVGHGFSLAGVGAITRDTMNEKDVFILKRKNVKGEKVPVVHHRYIVSIPGGVSAQIEYNPKNGRWVSIPQSFLDIEHKRAPGVYQSGGMKVVDPDGWIITSKDGTKYYFGEEEFSKNLAANGQIRGSENVYEGAKLRGSTGGSFYDEFDTVHLCDGESENNPCAKKKDKVLMVTKWMLRKVVSADGKEILYTYDTQQKKLDTQFDDKYDFVTSTSYPKEISWNDAKYKVRFEKETRPDKGNESYMGYRIKNIIVEAQRPHSSYVCPSKGFGSDDICILHRYELNYFDKKADAPELGEKTFEAGKPISNGFGASFLTSIHEYGTDNITKLPSVTFGYSQEAFSDGHSGESIYLSRINNGYGGETKIVYQPYEVGVSTAYKNPQSMMRRVRVKEKIVTDKVDGKSSKETYEYSPAIAYAPRLRDGYGGAGQAGIEFLGHKEVDVRSYDYDNSTVLAHTKTKFYQTIEKDNCIQEHPAKGMPEVQIAYNGNIEASRVETHYKYRLDGKDVTASALECKQMTSPQPYFVYNSDTYSTTQEKADSSFVPAPVATELKVQPQFLVRSRQSNLEYDLFGNVKKSVNWGEVDKEGNPVKPSDVRYSYSFYLTDGAAWIKGLPYLTYASNKSDCNDRTCQWGRAQMWYDNPEKNIQATWEDMQPKIGLLTQKVSYLNDSDFGFEQYEYHKLSSDSKDTRVGGIEKTWGPKPNSKTYTGDLLLTSTVTYDSFYHTLITEKKNTKGYWTKYEDFDYALGIPQTVKNQIDKDGTYTKQTMRFDSFGRLTMSFSPDPRNPGKTLEQPSVLTTWYEKGDQGLITRSASLSSKTSDGKYHYSVVDTFYNGVGQVRQSQNHRALINGEEKRTITIPAKTDADGKVRESYELQTAPVLYSFDEAKLAQGNGAVLHIQEPVFEQNLEKILVSTSDYDELRRPTVTTQIDPGTGEKYSSRTFYALNGTKTVDPKNRTSISLSDNVGRAINSLVFNQAGNELAITTNTYKADSLIEKPIQTDVTDGKGTVATSRFTYDKAGRLISAEEPSLGSYAFEYDVYGNKLVEKPYGNDRATITYKYDDLSRLSEKKYVKNDSSPLLMRQKRDSITFEYDNGAHALGKITKIENLIGEVRYEYDGGQRNSKTYRKVFDNEKTFLSKQNELSQEIESIMPGNDILAYEYDQTGAIKNTKLNGKELLTGVKLDKFGKKTEESFTFAGKKYTNKSNYDRMGRLHDYAVSEGNTSPLFSQVITYNPYAEIASIAESTNGTSNSYTYGYDDFSQLTSVDSNLYKASYAYDIFGRITKKNEHDEVTLAYDSTFPFYAPKSIAVLGDDDQAVPTPEPNPTSIPTVSPLPTGTTTTPIPTSCTYDAVAVVRSCDDVSKCNWAANQYLPSDKQLVDESKPITTFDESGAVASKYGIANDDQIAQNGDKPRDVFAGGMSEIHVDPYKGATGPVAVKLYYDSKNWEIIKREVKGPLGAPAEIDPNLPADKIGYFQRQCNLDVKYVWYVRPRKVSSPGDLNTQSVQSSGGKTSYTQKFTYNSKGALVEDNGQCYSYNMENQLIKMSVKKDRNQSCANTQDKDFKKIFYFFYDHEGTMVLQEEYNPTDMKKPTRQQYLFGLYEEIIEQ